MFKKLLQILAAFAVLGCLAGAGLAFYATRRVSAPQDAPLPEITADHSEAAVARGASIFHATCEACHRGPTSDRAAGAPIHDAPDWFGKLHSGNLTSDRSAGIGAVSDASLARTIRYGLARDRRWIPMPAYSLSDADVAAVLGFLRSGDPLFSPDPHPAPKSELSLAGAVVLFLGGLTTAPSRPTHIVAPQRGPSVEYGRYLAESVYQCGDCHTPGFDKDKVHGPQAFAGGAEMKNAAGELILSPNLTKDPEAGLGKWSREQFARALRDGIRPDGLGLGYPMPHFRGADDVEVEALWAYLRSFPANPSPVPGRAPAVTGVASTPDAGGESPAKRFATLGCATCHGPGARYESRLVGARAKPAEYLARWIRHPEAFIPGTMMPSFAPVLTEAEALELAEWLRGGGAKPSSREGS